MYQECACVCVSERERVSEREIERVSLLFSVGLKGIMELQLPRATRPVGGMRREVRNSVLF